MDKNRILTKINEMDKYVSEVEDMKPADFEEYENSVEKKRACERSLQLAIESVIDVCNMIVSELKLGIPSDEDDIINKIESNKIISKETSKILKSMKSFRNILVHKYGTIDDELVFEIISNKLEDFEKFKKEILKLV